MSDFEGRHFTGEIVLWAVRWYCQYGVLAEAVQFIGQQFERSPLKKMERAPARRSRR